MRPRNTLLLTLLLAFVGLYAAPLQAQSVSPGPFFDGEQFQGFDATGHEVYYLNYFKYFTYDPTNATYVYKYHFGWLCYLGNSSPTSHDAYFFDCNTSTYLWTDVSTYPYFYSFNLNTFLYYYEGSSPRVFYDFATQRVITY